MGYQLTCKRLVCIIDQWHRYLLGCYTCNQTVEVEKNSEFWILWILLDTFEYHLFGYFAQICGLKVSTVSITTPLVTMVIMVTIITTVIMVTLD